MVSPYFDWPRSQDEDVYQFRGAFLPVRGGRYIRDADKRAKQIDCIKVFPYVTAFDGAFDQSTNSPPGLTVRSLDELSRIPD